MRKLSVFLLGLALCAGAGTRAMAAANASETAAKKPGVAAVLERRLAVLERDVVPAADAMPAEKFDFAPGDLIKSGDFKGVKTFALQVRHIAATNQLIAASLLGEPSPLKQEEWDLGPAKMTSKDDIMAYLKDSFQNLHRAFALATSENLTEDVRSPFGSHQVPRLSIMVMALAHTNDHYGQMVEYLRMNGIIPPASRPQPAK